MVNPKLMEKIRGQVVTDREKYVEAVLEVICACIKDVAGEYPSDRLRDKLYDAIRHEL